MASGAQTAARADGPDGARPDGATGMHVVPMWMYFAVYGGLLILTASTVGAAFLQLGPFNDVVALAIAGLKAMLVVLYFMHVRWSSRLIPIVAVAGVFWLMHLVSGTLADYFTRGLLGVPGK